MQGPSREFRRRDRLYHISADPARVTACVQNLSSPLNHRFIIEWEGAPSPNRARISIREADDLESQALLGFSHPEVDLREAHAMSEEVVHLLEKVANGSPEVRSVFRHIVGRTRELYASESDRRRIGILFGKGA